MSWRMLALLVMVGWFSSLVAVRARACTSVLVSKGASLDGSTLITYAADSHELYGALSIRPPGQHAEGTLLDVFDGDSGKYLGQIKQAPKTLAVIGNMNERQVAIGETTFGGRKELMDPTATIDYGSLMTLALQRSTSAREAVRVMTELVAEYGYASEGESFSISDPHEVWILEMIGKGPGRRGAVWVARRVPDGMIAAHANQARIRTFPLIDKDTLYAKDVISFARERGYFQGKDEDFSFADAYAPLDYGALRWCEARVWRVFSRAAPAQQLSIDYVMGVAGAKPLPLWIKPDRKLSVQDVMELMRDHFEGTPLDLRLDVGAGPFHLPYRWRPLDWEVDGGKYLNERAVSTQQTGFSLVTQSRSWLPDPIGGVLWFGVDDTYSTVYLPMYAGLRSVPNAFAPGVASLQRFSWDSAFWVFNAVANLAYSRYEDMIKHVRQAQGELEGELLARQSAVEHAALKLFGTSPELARDYLTSYLATQTDRVLTRWRRLWEDLMVKYMDGNVKSELGAVTHPPYPEDWYRRIVADKPEHFRVLRLPGEPEPFDPVPLSGYFHSRSELGELGADVPADFPFEQEKLLLLPSKGICPRPPKCCLKPELEAKAAKLVVTVPKSEGDKCGAPTWLIRVPRNENRPVTVPQNRP